MRGRASLMRLSVGCVFLAGSALGCEDDSDCNDNGRCMDITEIGDGWNRCVCDVGYRGDECQTNTKELWPSAYAVETVVEIAGADVEIDGNSECIRQSLAIAVSSVLNGAVYVGVERSNLADGGFRSNECTCSISQADNSRCETIQPSDSVCFPIQFLGGGREVCGLDDLFECFCSGGASPGGPGSGCTPKENEGGELDTTREGGVIFNILSVSQDNSAANNVKGQFDDMLQELNLGPFNRDAINTAFRDNVEENGCLVSASPDLFFDAVSYTFPPYEYLGPDDDGGGPVEPDDDDDSSGGGEGSDGSEILAVLVVVPVVAALAFILYKKRGGKGDTKELETSGSYKAYNDDNQIEPEGHRRAPSYGRNGNESRGSFVPFLGKINSFARGSSNRSSKKGHTAPQDILNFMETNEGGSRYTPNPPSGRQHTIIDTSNIKEEDYAVNFSDLKLETPIASGAGGSVYKGTYCGKQCAIKELHVAFGTSNTHLELLKREATLLAKLRHPNLVYFWGFCLNTSRFYIVMEFCPKSVEDRLKEGYVFKGPEIVKYLSQFQQALQYLHQHNVLHRDLKPANLLFDHEDNLKVIDFGLARENNTGASIGNFTQAVGTPFYMAPEVFDSPGMMSGKHSPAKGKGYGKAADVYSYGIIAWQFVTGKASPYEEFHQTSLFSFFDAVRKGFRPSMKGIPPVMMELIDRCLQQDPAKRCPAVELAKYLTHPSLLDMDFVVPPEGVLSVMTIAEESMSETGSNVGETEDGTTREPKIRLSIHSRTDSSEVPAVVPIPTVEARTNFKRTVGIDVNKQEELARQKILEQPLIASLGPQMSIGQGSGTTDATPGDHHLKLDE